MWKYQKHPAGTPTWLTRAIFMLGAGIGLAIVAEFAYMFYMLTPVLSALFLDYTPALQSGKVMFYALIGVLAGVSGSAVVMMALAMNSLQRIALRRSIVAAGLTLLTGFVTFFSWFVSGTEYLHGIWVFLTLVSAVAGALVPMIILHTPAGRRLHRQK